MIIALAAVVRAYTCEAARAKRPSPNSASAIFDEEVHPLDDSGTWKDTPNASTIQEYVAEMVVALELDESSLVMGLIFLERAMASAQAPLSISARTWRPALLMAIVVASKVVYDEKVFLADYRDQLPHLCLDEASTQERAFLTSLSFNTTVRRGQYAKYYYALEDVARTTQTGASKNSAGFMELAHDGQREEEGERQD
jgi:hypothetical protein